MVVQDIVGFYYEYENEMKDKFLRVANFPELGVEIFITSEDGMVVFHVDIDGETKYVRSVVDTDDAIKVAFQNIVAVFSNSNDSASVLSTDDMKRLDEIDAATEYLLEVYLESSVTEAGLDPEEIAVISSNIAAMLCESFGASVRFPMEIDDEDTGLKVISQHPFE